MPASPARGERVYAALRKLGPLRQVLYSVIVRSDDGGTSWQTLYRSPPGRLLRQLAIAPSDPNRLYAVLSTSGKQAPEDVFASADGGRTWTNRGPLVTPIPENLTASTRLAVDQRDPDVLWGRGGQRRQLFHSTDAARTWQRLEFTNEPLTGLGVHTRPNGSTRIVGMESQSGGLIISDDSGTSWRRRSSPAGTKWGDSIVFGHTQDGLALLYSHLHDSRAQSGRVFRYDSSRDRFAEITPDLPEERRPVLYDLRTDATARALYARAPGAIWRYDGALDPGAHRHHSASPAEFAFGLRHVEPAKPKPARLTPGGAELRLDPGDVRVIDYTLRLPPRPTPLDLGILIDTTGSMGPSIRALREQLQRIVSTLGARGVRLRVGLAEYKEYADVPPYSGTEGGGGAYLRRRDLAEVDEELARALQALRALGGGTGEATPALAALYQLATGEGQRTDTRRTSNDIEPGQQLNYARRALRVVLHVTDAPYREGDPVNPAYPTPSVARTIAALTDRDILHVGIDVDHGPTSKGTNGRASLEHLSRRTGALATGPVDCDADGTVDLRLGDPLVCTVSDDSATVGNSIEAEGAASMADAMIGVLRSVRDEGTVRLHATSRSGVVTAGTPGPKVVDVTEPHRVHHPVRVSCPADAGGERDVVTLTARLNGAAIATAPLRVACGPDPEPAPVLPPRAAPPALGGSPVPQGHGPAAVVGPVLPPPAPLPVQAPAPGAAPAPGVSGAGAQVGAAQGQPGVAAAREEREHGALAVADANAAKAELPQELLTSEYLPASRRDTGTPPTVLAGAALMTAAAAYAALRRRRGRTAHARHGGE